MGEKARTATIAELARDGDGWSPLRMHLDVRSFGVNAWTASEAGGQLIGEHDEVPSGHEELYLITTGSATFTVEGDEIKAAAGTVVFVPDPASKRAAVADEPGTTVFAVGGQPDAVYRPRAWEQNATVFPLFGEGDYNGAKRALTEALDRYEDREGRSTTSPAPRRGWAKPTRRSRISARASRCARPSPSWRATTRISTRSRATRVSARSSARNRRRVRPG